MRQKPNCRQANLGYLLAWAELERTVGRNSGIDDTVATHDLLKF